MDVGVTFYFYTLTSPASATAQDHNELKRGKKSILGGQCTVCLSKANINVLWKKFRVGTPEGDLEWRKKNSKNIGFSLLMYNHKTPPNTHIWN